MLFGTITLFTVNSNCEDILEVYIYLTNYNDNNNIEKLIMTMMQLTKGGRKNNGPAFSAGQWPSQDCKAA